VARFASILRDLRQAWTSAVEGERLRSGYKDVRMRVVALARSIDGRWLNLQLGRARSLIDATARHIDRARLWAWLQRAGELASQMARFSTNTAMRLGGALAAAAPSRATLSEWLWRYLPLEIIATITALMGAGLVSLVTSNQVALAFAGTWGENIGFYGYAAWRDYRTHQGFLRLAGHMLVEFGPAEALDSFVVRPACMYLGQQMTGSLGWGIALGKIAADVVFYVLVIASYELKKRWLR